MAHNIFGQRLALRNGAAWHGIGKSLDGLDGKATTAVRIAEVNYAVLTLPAYVNYKGEWIPIEQSAIMRPPLDSETQPVQLGIASHSYTPITNYRVAELLDPLTEKWPCETAGALGRGEQFFITLNAGRASIAGDEMNQFMFIWNSHDGTGALTVMFTPVRVVCQNTCVMGMRAANVTTRVIHSRNVEAEAAFAMDLTVRLQAAQQNAMDELAVFPQIAVSSDQIKAVLMATYPDKPRDERVDALIEAHQSGGVELTAEQLGKMYNVQYQGEAQRERAAKLRLAAYTRIQQFNEDRPSFANTAWAVYQGITETESHREGGTAKSLAKSVMLGERGKNMQAAYNALIELAPVRR